MNKVDNKAKFSFIFVFIIDYFPIIIAISSVGTAPVLLFLLREKIELILPIKLGDVYKIAGKWRSEIKKYFSNFCRKMLF